MANNTIYFQNPLTGQTKEAPVGFSFTTALFGAIPMLFRGSWKWFAISAILGLCTWSLSNLVFMFIINKLYIKDLISDGYKAKGVKVGSIEQVSMIVGLTIPALEIAAAPGQQSI